jgi:putative FmdB family regulatory protein
MIGEHMPIYDYHCDHCGHTFSAVQSYTDATLEKCPSCGKRPRKLMATPAIVFKGGGWYKTDSRPKEKESGDKSPKKDAGSTTADSGDGSSKPATPAKADAPKVEAPKAAAPKGEAASS